MPFTLIDFKQSQTKPGIKFENLKIKSWIKFKNEIKMVIFNNINNNNNDIMAKITKYPGQDYTV